MEAMLEETTVARYDAYKDSGVEWLGEIPEDWDVLRLRFVLEEVNVRTQTGTEELLSLSKTQGVIPKSSLDDRSGLAASLIGYKKVFYKNLVINKMQAVNGLLAVSKINGITSPDYSVYKLINNSYSIDYFGYLLTQPEYLAEYKKVVTGAIEGFIRLYTNELYNILALVPPVEEQIAIANFLDDKTTKIDRAIAIKQKQIELLKERRQILIHNAVTRGLDPSVEMKDSGVEWIGEVPKHWEVGRIKQYSKKISKGTTPSTEGREILQQGKVRFLKSENICEGTLTHKPSFFIDEKTNSIMKRSTLEKNDVLFVIAGASLGKVAIMTEEFLPANTNQAVAFIRPNTKIHPDFLSKFLISNTINELTWLEAVQSAQPNLSMESLGNFPIALPDLEEQKQIVKYIEIAADKILTAILLKDKEIEKLKEYKRSLVNSVVTGKVKV